MSAAFDTLTLADKLESAGFTSQQARGAAIALSESRTADLATKSDIVEVKAEIAGVRSDINILEWIGSFTVALLVAVAVKMFVH